MNRRKYTLEELEYIKTQFGLMPVKDWINDYNQRFDSNKKVSTVYAVCKRYEFPCDRDGRFKKGQAAYNKGKAHPLSGRALETAFGGIRSNALKNIRPIGSYRFCPKDKYRLVKTENGWIHAHRQMWIDEHGPLTNDDYVRFLDNSIDKIQHPTLDNLYVVSRAVNARLSAMRQNELPITLRKTAVLIAQIEQDIANKIDGISKNEHDKGSDNH